MRPDPTFFHELLGREDWGRCYPADPAEALLKLWADEESGGTEAPARWDPDIEALTLPRLLEPAAPELSEPLKLTDRRAAAADANGNIYWIGDDPTQLYVRSSGDRKKSLFWPDPRAFSEPRATFVAVDPALPAARRYSGLAVTSDAWLVASFGDEDGASGLEAFDLVGGGAPVEYCWLEDVPLEVRDLDAAPCGGLWLLDARSRLIYLDRRLAIGGSPTGEPEPDLFQPESGEARTHAPREPLFAWDLSGIDPSIEAIAIAPLSCEAIAVLSEDGAKGRIYVLNSASRSLISTARVELGPVHDIALGKVLLRNRKLGERLIVTLKSGAQAIAFVVDGEGKAIKPEPTGEKFLLRRHKGRALPIVDGAIDYDSGDVPSWVPLAEFPVASFAGSSSLVTPVFDGGIPATTWDRLRLDGCIPPGTAVHVEARSGEDDVTPDMLGQWFDQPGLLLSATGGELAAYDPAAIPATDPAHGKGSWEFLFQHMRGRFLQLRITLIGNKMSSPELHSLRAWYPRQSWAERYLPAAYRADPVPADFLERFLANMEGTVSTLERRIVDAQALFDPGIAPVDALGWLASWFDVALDPSWSEGQQRLFLAHAAEFLSMRGTKRGLETALGLAFNPCADDRLFVDPDSGRTGIRISESFLTRRLAALAGVAAASADRWTPDKDNVALAEKIAILMGKPHADPDERAQPVPLFPPAEEADKWTSAMMGALGFVPDDSIAERLSWRSFQQSQGQALLSDLPRGGILPTDAEAWASFTSTEFRPRSLWQDFLGSRYGRVALLNAAHGASWTSFEEVALFDHLPATPRSRKDWYDFETFLLPADEAAHRFTVLLPVATVATDLSELARRRELARRIIDLEKPAHTAFEITFYFAMNRIGDARLGLDTTLGDGSRASELVPPAILGRAYLGESFLGAQPEPALSGRTRLAC